MRQNKRYEGKTKSMRATEGKNKSMRSHKWYEGNKKDECKNKV